MAINEELKNVVRRLLTEIIDGFKAEGKDLNSCGFLAEFPFAFIRSGDPGRREALLAATFSPLHGADAEKALAAAYSDHRGGTPRDYLCDAVEDFLNYAIPRIAGLPDEATQFDELYSQFEDCLFGENCLVTTFAVLKNVWDNGGRVVLSPGFSLRYVSTVPGSVNSRWLRDRVVPFLELSKGAHPIGRGRDIKDQPAYFLFTYTANLPRDMHLISRAYALRDEIPKEFVFSVRLLKQSAAFSDYRGFRTLGHLSGFSMNLMNFPDDYIERDAGFELDEHDGIALRRLMPKLATNGYGSIAVLDTKIEDAIRRARESMLDERRTEMKIAIDQLLDYFQVLEAVVPVDGSEYIALYAAVLLKACGPAQFSSDPYSYYKFMKRMHKIRNDVMHGRMNKVLDSKKDDFKTSDLQLFRYIVHVLAALFVLNGNLRDGATKLALGQPVSLDSVYKVTVEEMNKMREQQPKLTGW